MAGLNTGKSDGSGSAGLPLRIQHTPGIVTITDPNTTIGYCRYDECGEVEYVFVSHAHRRKGYARLMLAIVEKHLELKLRFQPPISALGGRLALPTNDIPSEIAGALTSKRTSRAERQAP